MAVKFTFNPFVANFDAIQDVSGFVPYTGATQDVDLGIYDLTATEIYGDIHTDNIFEKTASNNIVFHNNIVPNANTTLDLGENSTPLRWRTLYLGNDGGIIFDVPTAIETNGAGGGATDYTFELGGGFTGIGTGGGVFNFVFDSAVAGGENLLKFDLGAVWYAGGAAISNDFIIQCDSGLDRHRFIAKFGGFSNPEYGWALDREVILGDSNGKTLFFDNQDTISDVRRSIDLRIDGDNVLTIENEILSPPASVQPHTVDFPLRYISAPGGIVINRFASIDSQTVFNLYDILTVKAVNANAGGILSVKPDGTSPTSAMLTSNATSTTDYGTLENSIQGTVARFATWRLATGIGPTELRIGEMTSAFFGVGLTDALTTIDFYFANAIACQIQPNTMIFNNGATDTQIDWSVNGQLGFQVATNDILRLTATQVQALQNVHLLSDSRAYYCGASDDMSIDYNGTVGRIQTDLVAASDLQIDCGTDKTIELQETVWRDINIGAEVLSGPPGQQPSQVQYVDENGTNTGIYTYGVAVGEAVGGKFELQHDYKEGTDISFHIHWMGTSAPTGTDNVQWELTYTVAQTNTTLNPVSVITVETGYDTQYEAVVSSLPTITGTSFGIGDQFIFTLERIAATANEYAGTGLLFTVGIHYEVNTMGSRQTFIK